MGCGLSADLAAYPLVLVEWNDACGAGAEWLPLVDVTKRLEPVVVLSVGWQVAESENALVLVPHMYDGDDERTVESGCGDMLIPKSAVRRIVVL